MCAKQRYVCAVLLAAGLVATGVAGCGPQSTPAPPPDSHRKLSEVWDLYKAHLDARKKPPGKLVDLEPYEPGAMYGYAAAQAGEVTILFGGKDAPLGSVLAYEKTVPQDGGQVLLRDGTVKAMTAAEFQAAPKVGEAK